MEKLIESDLTQFTGTDHYYPHGLGNTVIHLTDGTKHVAEAAGAYWFFDIILSYQGSKTLKNEEFQRWKLEKKESGGWLVTCDDGNRNILITQEVPYSDFPLNSIKVYLIDGICLLPSEN